MKNSQHFRRKATSHPPEIRFLLPKELSPQGGRPLGKHCGGSSSGTLGEALMRAGCEGPRASLAAPWGAAPHLALAARACTFGKLLSNRCTVPLKLWSTLDARHNQTAFIPFKAVYARAESNLALIQFT